MYKVFKVRGIIRIPPEYFGQPLDQIAMKLLREQYQEKLHKDLGLILGVLSAKVSEEGVIVFGDGATYHSVEFEVLSFVPVNQEIVYGIVSGVDNIGLYVNLGPLDGLVHISQISDEPLKYDPARGALIGERTKKIFQKGDKVKARIISVSSVTSGRPMRIVLTMRQPTLGKIE
ncbi:MAG: DNA-directed RNA polymerase [Sulfolobaceae archaeon]|nr:DNA-directed RNA polymerase [Sulfolobaceae archaeon]